MMTPEAGEYYVWVVSVLFSEPKILNQRAVSRPHAGVGVSVLFSEPKILNSNDARNCAAPLSPAFQCSSASRKFSITGLRHGAAPTATVSVLFSEPKILNEHLAGDRLGQNEFQCSSASRKFSIPNTRIAGEFYGQFQCSSASRKFSIIALRRTCAIPIRVSVLFSEPKILNHYDFCVVETRNDQFQCSSASRKFSIEHLTLTPCIRYRFSALQRAENSQSRDAPQSRVVDRRVSVLFSEPKILNSSSRLPWSAPQMFQCSSASRKFSIA